MLRFLADQEYQINQQASNGHRAVNDAARLRNIEALAYLVNRSAALSWPPLDRYAWCSALQSVIAYRRQQVKQDGDPRFEAVLKWLIANNCSFDTCKSWQPLHSIVQQGLYEDIPLLVKLGANVNETGFVIVGSRTCTPLLAYNGPYGDDRGVKTVKTLLELGADPRAKGPNGVSPADYYKSLLEKYSDREEHRNELTEVIRLIEPGFSAVRKTPSIRSNSKDEKNPSKATSPANSVGKIVIVGVVIMIVLFIFGAT